MVVIVSIEGNIGSGKSTVIENLKLFFETTSSNDNNIFFLEEPVHEWNTIKDSDGINIIQKFYADQNKYSFSFQMMAYISRLAQLKQTINKGYDIIVCERSLFTDKNVFAQMLYDSGLMEDVNYQIYIKWFDHFICELPEINYVYIKTNPEIAYERILKRNRLGESMTQEYINMCHKYHHNWLNDISLNIDGNNDIDTVFGTIKEYLLKLKL